MKIIPCNSQLLKASEANAKPDSHSMNANRISYCANIASVNVNMMLLTMQCEYDVAQTQIHFVPIETTCSLFSNSQQLKWTVNTVSVKLETFSQSKDNFFFKEFSQKTSLFSLFKRELFMKTILLKKNSMTNTIEQPNLNIQIFLLKRR